VYIRALSFRVVVESYDKKEPNYAIKNHIPQAQYEFCHNYAISTSVASNETLHGNDHARHCCTVEFTNAYRQRINILCSDNNKRVNLPRHVYSLYNRRVQYRLCYNLIH